MKTATTTLTQDEIKLSLEQLRFNAEQRLTELDGQINEAVQTLATTQAEIGRINTVATERKERLAGLQRAAQHATTSVTESRNRAALAQKTLGERQEMQKVKGFERAYRSVQNDLLKVEEEDMQASPVEQEQLRQLQVQIESLQADILRLRETQEDTRRVHVQATRELGEETLRSSLVDIEGLQHNVEQAKRALLDAELAFETYLEEAMAKLAEEWPDLAQKLWPYLPTPDDATLRVMKACLNYMDQLLADRQQLKPTLPEVPEVARTMRWWEVLEVGHDVFYGVQQLNSTSPSHQVLQNKRDFVARMIEVYERAYRNQL